MSSSLTTRQSSLTEPPSATGAVTEQPTVIRSPNRSVVPSTTAAWIPPQGALRSLPDHPPLYWQSWPLRDEPVERALWVAVLIIAAIATSAATGSVAATVFAVTVVLAATVRVWLPVHFRLDSRGLTETHLGRSRLITWRMIGRYRICRRGLLLYTTRHPSALDGLARRYVPWREDPTVLLAALAKRVGPPSGR